MLPSCFAGDGKAKKFREPSVGYDHSDSGSLCIRLTVYTYSPMDYALHRSVNLKTQPVLFVNSSDSPMQFLFPLLLQQVGQGLLLF